MNHWINHCNKQESQEFASQIMCDCYIPWHPAGGRHIMDDFGTLQEALPAFYYLPEFNSSYDIHWTYQVDQQYRSH